MLSPAGRSGLRAQKLAAELGCEVRETLPKVGWSQPALLGAKGELAAQLKSAGGRWSSSDEVILFPTWSTLEEVLEEIIEGRRFKAA
ncbi:MULTISPECIES: hypothetical protein [unclassified Variovorax]|uniref:hypothetical protein n=1 Tax=unclassified Variovorax TaxID=663243 RepID=UPI001160D7B2|nr:MULTISPECIES: hypothetical protein [unclassified Variovorax]